MAARSHHYFFAHRYVPGVFQSDPGQFMATLIRDEMKFVQFMWDRAGQNTPPDDRIDPKGLAVTVRKAERDIQVAIITLPKPEAMTEAYFVAPVYHPQLNGALVARYYTLELTFSPPDDHAGTMLCGWSGTIHFNRGAGPSVDLDAFFQAVQQEIINDVPGPKP